MNQTGIRWAVIYTQKSRNEWLEMYTWEERKQKNEGRYEEQKKRVKV